MENDSNKFDIMLRAFGLADYFSVGQTVDGCVEKQSWQAIINDPFFNGNMDIFENDIRATIEILREYHKKVHPIKSINILVYGLYKDADQAVQLLEKLGFRRNDNYLFNCHYEYKLEF